MTYDRIMVSKLEIAWPSSLDSRGHGRAPADLDVWFRPPGSYVLSIITCRQGSFDFPSLLSLLSYPLFNTHHLLQSLFSCPPLREAGHTSQLWISFCILVVLHICKGAGAARIQLYTDNITVVWSCLNFNIMHIICYFMLNLMNLIVFVQVV